MRGKIQTKEGEQMKGFIKFMSVVAFGIFCFIGGVALGDGKNYVAVYCVCGGVWILLNGYAAALEMETHELIEGNRKKTTTSSRRKST